ncbi:MAG: phosphate signaling complex protein PhoU [Phycisphaeraceae bacterium]
MSAHFQRQITNLKQTILALGAQVEQAVQRAIEAVHERDPDLAQRVIDGDEQIDMLEVDLEEECLHTLALHQPVAFDLRYVIAVLKINNELERIGDLAVNIAQQAMFLAEQAQPPHTFDMQAMSGLVRRMVKQSLDALVNIDPALAERVREQDDEVDAIHRAMYQKVEAAIAADVAHTEQYIHMLSVSRNLERMADHAVNVAEDVVYMARGEILRHTPKPDASEKPK